MAEQYNFHGIESAFGHRSEASNEAVENIPTCN